MVSDDPNFASVMKQKSRSVWGRILPCVSPQWEPLKCNYLNMNLDEFGRCRPFDCSIVEETKQWFVWKIPNVRYVQIYRLSIEHVLMGEYPLSVIPFLKHTQLSSKLRWRHRTPLFPYKTVGSPYRPHEITTFAAQGRWTNTGWKSRNARVPYLRWFLTGRTGIKYGNWESSINGGFHKWGYPKMDVW